MRPLADRIVVKPLDAHEVSAGGIHIPQSAQKAPQEGVVVAVGPGTTTDEGAKIPMELKKDDIVIYAKFTGTEIIVNDEEVLIMRESDVLAVLTEPKEPVEE